MIKKVGKNMEDLVIEEYRKKLKITNDFYEQLIRKLAFNEELTEEESALILKIVTSNVKK